MIWNQSWTCTEKNVANKPDIVWIRPDGLHVVIEVSVPHDGRAAIVRNDKREKYVPFCCDLSGRRGVRVDFIPLVVGA